MSRTPVGEVRPSQLLWTYGPGALIDLPNLSVVTMGIDRWEKIDASRSKRRVCWPTCGAFSALRSSRCGCRRSARRDVVDPFSAAPIGVPVKPFPRWMRCVKCGLLSPSMPACSS